jgi:ribosomal protein S18 acetylase RimI-like enzyme
MRGALCLSSPTSPTPAPRRSAEHGGEAWWIDELYVVPPWRSRSIGTELVRTAIELATAAGARALELEVEETHARAAHLYARAGFRRLTRQRWVAALVR